MSVQNFSVVVEKLKNDLVLRDVPVKENLDAIEGDKNSGLEHDLEQVKIDDKYKLNFEGNLLSESVNNEFDYGIFKEIGLIKIDNNNILLNSNINVNNHLLYRLNNENKVKLIETYFQIETLRYCNQKVHSYLYTKKKLYNILHYLSIAITVVLSLITYAIDNLKLVDNANIALGIIIPALVFINYVLHRILVLTNVNGNYFINLQKQLTKMRLMIETIIIGTHPKNSDNDITDILNKVQIDIKELNNVDEIINNKVINELITKSSESINLVNNKIINQLTNKIKIIESLNEIKNEIV